MMWGEWAEEHNPVPTTEQWEKKSAGVANSFAVYHSYKRYHGFEFKGE